MTLYSHSGCSMWTITVARAYRHPAGLAGTPPCDRTAASAGHARAARRAACRAQPHQCPKCADAARPIPHDLVAIIRCDEVLQSKAAIAERTLVDVAGSSSAAQVRPRSDCRGQVRQALAAIGARVMSTASLDLTRPAKETKEDVRGRLSNIGEPLAGLECSDHLLQRLSQAGPMPAAAVVLLDQEDRPATRLLPIEQAHVADACRPAVWKMNR